MGVTTMYAVYKISFRTSQKWELKAIFISTEDAEEYAEEFIKGEYTEFFIIDLVNHLIIKDHLIIK